MAARTSPTWPVISAVSLAVCVASSLTSPATTATFPRVAGTCRLDRSIECQQIGPRGDFADHVGHRADLPHLGVQRLDGHTRLIAGRHCRANHAGGSGHQFADLVDRGRAVPQRWPRSVRCPGPVWRHGPLPEWRRRCGPPRRSCPPPSSPSHLSDAERRRAPLSSRSPPPSPSRAAPHACPLRHGPEFVLLRGQTPVLHPLGSEDLDRGGDGANLVTPAQ